MEEHNYKNNNYNNNIIMCVTVILLMTAFILIGIDSFDFKTNITATVIYFILVGSLLIISIIVVIYQIIKHKCHSNRNTYENDLLIES